MKAGRGIGVVAVLFFLAGFMGFGQDKSSVTETEIAVEEADITSMVELVGSTELSQLATEVYPRIVVDHAALSASRVLSGSGELARVANQVAPRIVILNAATSALRQDLTGLPELKRIAHEVFPRIWVEHAEIGVLRAPSAPQLAGGPPSPSSPPAPTPLLIWALIGLAAGLLVAFLVWKLLE